MRAVPVDVADAESPADTLELTAASSAVLSISASTTQAPSLK